MLKLRKVQILGFKSFCDRTEVALSGGGVAAVVGPNGCGKSNISDAITWVLGEQSAKSLRGIKMEDVIFAGTRDRKPTGMAEVSLTLVDPDLYDGSPLHPDGPELVINDQHPADWNEDDLRAQTAAETEAAVADAQPGLAIEDDGDNPPPSSAEAAGTTPDDVVLRIRRRKFNRAPVRAGEVTVTRRLFRTGDSEYLLNGRICRLRDIQDIFMGTGLGGESYAIIGQERIGQILSAKPLDRRGIIEEAAGITRFKTKKRLAELRLESAKGNLARVNDIFDEVTRQMGTLKRQAAKAEKYAALRDEFRAKLRVSLRSRMQQLDRDHLAATQAISTHTATIDEHAAGLEGMDAEHTAGVERGYELDRQLRESTERASQTAVEIERIAARAHSNAERVAELGLRLETGNVERATAREHVAQLAGELAQHRTFLERSTAEFTTARDAAHQRQAESQNSIRAVQAAEQAAEQSRRNALQLMQRSSQIRNEIAQAQASLAALHTESERLGRESDVARDELASLGLQRGQVRMSFESVTERLQRLEAEIARLRLETEGRRKQEAEARQRGNQLRSELASLNGRRGSLEGLIRDHSYSTDTVKNLFRSAKRAAAPNGQPALAPVGTLADLLEVEGQFGAALDEFLRDELSYIVVRDWSAASEGLRLLRSEVNGRATFLIHSPAGTGAVLPEVQAESVPVTDGLTPLRDCVRVGGDLNDEIFALLPRLRDGYVVRDAEQARTFAAQFPRAWFVTPAGEIFHSTMVTGGRAANGGPLALKRDLRELSEKAATVEAELAHMEITTTTLAREIAESNAAIESKTQERREAEREAANSGAALRQMDSEAQRLNRRLEEWQLASERNRDQRTSKTDLIARREADAEAADREHTAIESSLADLQGRVAQLRTDREQLQAAAAEASAALAGLEERRRNAQNTHDQTQRVLQGQQARLQTLEGQLAAAAAERTRREEETATLQAQHAELKQTHAAATADAAALGREAASLRASLAELDGRLRVLRAETDALREARAAQSTRAARLAADIEHIDLSCQNELAVEPAVLRADEAVALLEGEPLAALEEETRGMKGRLEGMGPVNMMALEEFNETSERHTFLDAQRKDLLDSISNTQASIKEIDDVSRQKFDDAFKVINANFSVTFTKLFGGGQALMKLTDEENSAESGIDIIASPPGKKLQNVLLLSGGEKALTALSLLVGIFQFQPAPFCILDEVDAPLDETNVGRFSKLIGEMSATTQFIVITHSKRTMAQADVIFGVTMQEPGVSKIVSVNLKQRGDADRRAVA